MIVYREHVTRLDGALRKDEPIVVLPPLHPDYLRRLVLAWMADHEERRPLVRLFEPGLGSSKLIPKPGDDAGGVLGGCRPSPSVAEFLRLLIEEAEPLGPGASSNADPGGRPTTIYWLTGSNGTLTDPVDASLLTALCRRIVAYRLPWRLLLDAPDGPPPPTLAAWKRDLELQAPRNEPNAEDMFSEQVLRELSPDLYDTLRKRGEGERTGLDNVVRKVQGLDAAAINLVLAAAVQQAPQNAEDDETLKGLEEVIEKERGRQLMRASGLEVVLIPSDPEELKGMNRFQRYLDYVSVLFDDSGRPGADGFGPRPRGVLLAGLPGCGKSLAAGLAAARLGGPLVRMDVGGMLGRYLGESEANLRRALDAAEAAAPCVLWVDEIEKALGGTGDEGGGTSKRMLGQLLTWMQDHKSQVYIFATANSVANLPPELLRRGRFDELWRVMLPTPEERESILRSKLAGLKQDLDEAFAKDDKAIKKVVQETKDFTGADITSLVQEAWMAARVFEQKVTKRHLLEVLKRGFVPMSAQFEDEIKKSIEALDKHGFRNVTCAADEVPPAVREERKKARGRLVPELSELWTGPQGRVVIHRGRKKETLKVGVREGHGRAVWLADGAIEEWPHPNAREGMMSRQGGRLEITLTAISSEDPKQTLYLAWDSEHQSITFRSKPVKVTLHIADEDPVDRGGLNELTVKALQQLAKAYGVTATAGKRKADLIETIVIKRKAARREMFERLKVGDLRKLAVNLGVENVTKKRKPELVDAILDCSHARRQETLAGYSVGDLRRLAGKLGVVGYSKMRKAELVDAIEMGGHSLPSAEPARQTGREPKDRATNPGATGERRRLGRGDTFEFVVGGVKRRIKLPNHARGDAILSWGDHFEVSTEYSAERRSPSKWVLTTKQRWVKQNRVPTQIDIDLPDSGRPVVRVDRSVARKVGWTKANR